jgi:sulfate adenylyltransferase
MLTLLFFHALAGRACDAVALTGLKGGGITVNEPHGGKLINRLVTGERAQALEAEACGLYTLTLNPFEVSDLEMLAIGGFSPLQGFMSQPDYQAVIRQKRLASGLPWTLPVTLAVTSEQAGNLRRSERVALADSSRSLLAVLQVQDVYSYDREAEAREVFGTTDEAHPGVAYLATRGDRLVGGRVEVFRRPNNREFAKYRLDPPDTRRIFAERGWKTVVGFQTRNPVHRAHEYIQKTALEIVDGLLLHPIAGKTKSDDISLAVRMRCYEVLLNNYYPADRVLLALNPASMRYAGPREAIFHALVRKNFGCTHFIVGRDHAGVGNFYGPHDAQKVFDEFDAKELGITPLFFENSFYCRRCAGMATPKTCGHDAASRVALSGTQVRAILSDGGQLPPEFTRPEVAEVLHAAFLDSRRGQ